MDHYCDPGRFRCVDHAVEDIGTALRDLCSGAVPAIRIPRFLSAADAKHLTSSFLQCPEVEERQDGVWGKYLGAYHYRRTFEDYRAQIDRTSAVLSELLKAVGDPLEHLNDEIGAALLSGPSARNRPAVWHGSPVATARMSAWLPSTEYLLDAHDDIGQLRDPEQKGFEPQRIPDDGVIAVNLYTSSPAEGGKLRLWNVMSNTAVRHELGIARSGYPYPGSFLDAYDYIDVQPRTGDLVLINGAIPHAVTLHQADEPRVAVNYFFGRLGESIIRWV
ncbi:hypothetical protein [Streptomyces sp. NBC_00019]|uniref:hypothetical protein n=1 Tax=Streptomyces sp. NBC_00019 TaxID=2975623 RepID=UPI00325691C2